MITICLKCKNQFEAKASWQKLCFKCYRETPKAVKSVQSNDEIMNANRKIYAKLLDIQEAINQIEIQELKLRLATLGTNLEKLLATHGKTDTKSPD